MDKETYNILSSPDAKDMVKVRRVSDRLVTQCKRGWLACVSGDVFRAINKTKAIRLDGLEWATEE